MRSRKVSFCMPSSTGILLKTAKFLGALLLALFTINSPAQAAVEYVPPLESWCAGLAGNWIVALGGNLCGYPTPFAAGQAAAAAMNTIQPLQKITIISCNSGGGCNYTTTFMDGSVLAVFGGWGIKPQYGVCPAPTVNPTVPYQFNPSILMCERTLPDTLTITLLGGASIEPWNKRNDPKHLKANLSFTATVANAYGPLPAGIQVSITADVTQFSGGHIHDKDRLKGRLIATPEGTPAPVSTVKGTNTLTGTIDSNGVFSFAFGAEEASGVHKLSATCTGCITPATASIDVAIQGLMQLDGDPSIDVLRGDNNLHANNHYFSEAAIVKIINLAHAYKKKFGEQLQINDSSLSKGGLFDISGEWRPSHKGHRKGIVVDINNYRSDPDPLFEDMASTILGIEPVWEGPDITNTPHYHLLLLGKDQ